MSENVDELTWARWEKEQTSANKASTERSESWENGTQTNLPTE